MRLLFVGMEDPNGWMFEYSKLINKYTDNISNCILYRDLGGYGADIVLKENGQKKEKMITCDKIDLIHGFAKETDLFIFNGCDINIHNFKYGRIDWTRYINHKPFIFFLGDKIYSKDQLFMQWSNLPAITNQPVVYQDFAFQGLSQLGMVRPMLDLPMDTNRIQIDKKVNSFLYRDETGTKEICNLNTFLMIFSFIYNELGKIDYVSYRNTSYETVKAQMNDFMFSFDMISPLGLYSRASIEAVCNGSINFVGLTYKEISLLSQLFGCECDVFDTIASERDLYEKAKQYIIYPEFANLRAKNIKEKSVKLFDGSHIQEFIDLL